MGARRRAASWRWTAAALLGLTGPARPASSRSPFRRSEASGYEAPAAAVNPLQFGRAYQLPPFGRGNGIEALFWTPLARVPADIAPGVLVALAAAGIPGWAAPVRPARRGAPPHEDLWASSAEVERAQDVVMQVLRDRD
ncbi:hypothetical protein [Amnibacterium endophyticum]|uniref:Uncharacterized protein n=1 Tax=Amnibacterium endophyticum TaxID=2109337 RepID=A0ABW4LHM9_9MICO